jgi:hypothetical protein
LCPKRPTGYTLYIINQEKHSPRDIDPIQAEDAGFLIMFRAPGTLLKTPELRNKRERIYFVTGRRRSSLSTEFYELACSVPWNVMENIERHSEVLQYEYS